jgi:hypothetical protein
MGALEFRPAIRTGLEKIVDVPIGKQHELFTKKIL